MLLFLFLDSMQIKLVDPACAHTPFQQICHQQLPQGSDVKTREYVTPASGLPHLFLDKLPSPAASPERGGTGCAVAGGLGDP